MEPDKISVTGNVWIGKPEKRYNNSRELTMGVVIVSDGMLYIYDETDVLALVKPDQWGIPSKSFESCADLIQPCSIFICKPE